MMFGRFFKRLSLILISLVFIIIFLNIYMMFVVNSSLPSLQLDLSVDGDLFGFHEDHHDHVEGQPLPPDDGPTPKPHQGHLHPEIPDPRFLPPCMGICPAAMSSLNQSTYVNIMIESKIRKLDLKPKTFSRVFPHSNTPTPTPLTDYASLWSIINAWINPRNLYPTAYHNWSFVSQAISKAPIVRASNVKFGVQVKALVEFAGGQTAVVKPKRYDRDFVIDGLYDGADRHNGEIAAFHLARLLGLHRVPIAVGRKLNLRNDVFRVADASLLDAFFINDNDRLCLLRKGKCAYCNKKEYSACAEKGTDLIESVVILMLPESVQLKQIVHPWARNYRNNSPKPWELDPLYCNAISAKQYLGEAPIFLDLIDTSIFDYLIGNADRHTFEVVWNAPLAESMVFLLDNGKSFGNPYWDELTILAPLYQCCRVRLKMYDTLKYFAKDMNLASAMDLQMQSDPLYPVLNELHLEAVNRRLVKVLALLELCIARHGREVVLVNDGFR